MHRTSDAFVNDNQYGEDMTANKKTLLTGVSTAALLAAALPAFAQTATEDKDPAATANVAGGQVVVEQEDAEVDVKVPDPDVNVSQKAPVVTVEQPQPEVNVAVPEPTVRVQQQAPIITVEQAQPNVTVRIPEPVVKVMVPQPEVDVETGEPVVDLDQPEPVVRFVRPEPKITIEEAEPRIEVSEAKADVNVDEAEKAKVDVEQAEAKVNVQEADGANVVVDDAEKPEVKVVDGGKADVDVEQEQARVVMEDFNADEEGRMNEEDHARYQESVQRLPIFNLRVDQLVDRSIATESGEDVGEIDSVGKRGDTIVAIVGVGGFLGMGENEVAIPVEKLILREDEVIVPGVTEERLEAMPEFNESEVVMLNADARLSDEIGLD